jgi:hypothetical protein
MFFYRYKVDESHLNKYAFHLHEAYLSQKSLKVATAGPALAINKAFDTSTREMIYFVVDKSVPLEDCPTKPSKQPHPAILGFCAMSRMPRWVALETNMLYVNPEARGRGIATTIYDSIMKDGVIVMSGYSHNQKSRRLWMNIAQNPKYVVWAHDIVDLNRYADVTVEEDTFSCELKIYEDIKKIRRRRRADVRFIAYNPRYVS